MSEFYYNLLKCPDVDQLLQHYFEIQCLKEKKFVYESLTRLWKLRTLPFNKAHNPAPLPVSLTEDHLRSLDFDNFTVTAKIDGLRVLLLLINYQMEQKAYFITRNMQMFELQVAAPKTYFDKGVLVDGEITIVSDYCMSKSDTTAVFYAFDIINCCGNYMGDKFLQDRVLSMLKILSISNEDLHSLIESKTREEDSIKLAETKQKIVPSVNPFALVFEVKPYYNCNDLMDVFGGLKEAENMVDGLILTHKYSPLGTGRSSNIMRWKPCPTVDLGVSIKSGNEIVLMCAVGKEAFVEVNSALVDVGCCEAVILEPKHNLWIEHLVNKKNGSKIPIFEFSVRQDDQIFSVFALKPRKDKERPNMIQTVVQTLQNVQENITFDDLRQKWVYPSRNLFTT